MWMDRRNIEGTHMGNTDGTHKGTKEGTHRDKKYGTHRGLCTEGTHRHRGNAERGSGRTLRKIIQETQMGRTQGTRT